jgi:hypothetical protein
VRSSMAKVSHLAKEFESFGFWWCFLEEEHWNFKGCNVWNLGRHLDALVPFALSQPPPEPCASNPTNSSWKTKKYFVHRAWLNINKY